MHSHHRLSAAVLIIALNGFMLPAQSYSLVAKSHVVYVHSENELCLTGTNGFASSLSFKTDNGTIRKLDGRLWLIPAHTGKAEISMYRLTNGKRKLVGRFVFRASNYPVYAMVGTLKGGAVSQKAILAMGGLRAYAEGSECQPYIPVTGYQVTAMRGNICLGSFSNTGSAFQTDTKSILSQLQAGDHLLFFGIEVCINNEENRALTPLEFSIIE